MSASVQAFKNTVLTQIAVKRLSGKAQVSGLLSLAEEKHGSTPQTLGSTVLAELVPSNPIKTEWLIQSASDGANGTAMYVEFDLEAISDGFYAGTETNDDGASTNIAETDGGTSYNHAYAIKLPSDFTSNAVFTNAGTPTAVGSGHFTDGYNFTGSLGRLQLIPEFASDNVDDNPYKIQIFNAAATEISDVSPMDWYVDTYAGILFLQDPINDVTNLPVTLKGFLYIGKYQDEMSYGGGDTVDIHISDGTNGFSIANTATASFESGSAGITVSSSNDNKITIGNATDNVTFNDGLFTGTVTVEGDIIAQNYIVSSSVTYMTQSFSSGSTVFGDTVGGAFADTHQFTGSIYVTGSTFTWDGLGYSDNITPLVIDSDGNITTGSAYATSASLALLSSSFEEVEASASAGIHFSSSNGSFSVSLVDTASFSASGAGLTVNLTSGDVEYVVNPNTLIEAVDTSTEINITASYANSAVNVQITDDENTAQYKPVIFVDGPGTGNLGLKSDGSTFNYNPGLATLQIGTNGGSTISISNNSIKTTGGTFNLFSGDNNPTTINLGTEGDDSLASAQYLNIGTSSGEFTTYISGTLTLNLKETDESAGVFNILNISASTERTPLVIDSSGRVSKADVDFAAGSQILTVTESADSFGVVFTKRVATELTHSGDLQEHVPQGTTGFTFKPDKSLIQLQNQPNSTSNNNYITFNPESIKTSGSNVFDVLTGTTAPETINVGKNTGTVFFNGSASIAGDLIVQGATTTISTTNLLVEDAFILLASGSGATGNGGIIIERTTNGEGTALFWDETTANWAIDAYGADASNHSSVIQDAAIAFVSRSAGLPGTTFNGPVVVGDAGDDNYKKGQFYVDTSDDYGLYVFL